MIHDGPKACRKVLLEIGHRHLAAQQKGHRPREQSQADEDSAAKLQNSRRQHPGIVKHGMSPKSPKELHRAVAGEQECKHHSRQSENEILSLDIVLSSF